MLTATYSLLAIRSEQKNVCSILARLRGHVQSTRRQEECVDALGLASILSQLQQFDRYFHARKIERYVIPAVCCTTNEADLLVDKLEILSSAARRSLASLQQHVQVSEVTGDHPTFCAVAEQYCDAMLARLVKEEESLMSLIGEVLTREDLFALGARFLADDGNKYTSRRVAPPLVPLAPTMPGERTATY
ncbi:hypothetical protein QN362_14645 [Actimicrobium sp. CCC2.4]|uniref:hypothetical protein n=1 Tax=Actimicrobium sp. CCC2.4 TaxID=3048606 RepID=UPI002AC96D94|nr:hypothetical protein [Actimicrobium sp. CCC2.4]MEB0136575.1 hypothetical protein [Actimicrobium sp. CCC2.4]WPX31739.1 hypothetical protein RHM62_16095 [Actimicrobium sp. CCC2.4]